MSLVEVNNLKTHFPIRAGVLQKPVGWVRAVDGVSFTINDGVCVGLVGESGCGKTTLGRTLLRLIEPTAGTIQFAGQEITDLRTFRRQAQMIFQDPYGSLNPRMTVGKIIGEPLRIHKLCTGPADERDRVAELLKSVGLAPEHSRRYPHEFSGGQRQRIGIARALAMQPKFIVCDEPVSALDVSVQAAIVNLLADLRDRLGVAYLFISHDISVVAHLADRIAVMQNGKIVEIGDTASIIERPSHPYTIKLISSVPRIDKA